MNVSTTVHYADWRSALVSAHSEDTARRPLVVITLETEEGVRGYGEAAPLESYDGVSVEAVLEDLEGCEPILAAADGDDHAATLAECRERARLPQALAAIDLALWDLAGRQLDQPVWELLGASTPDRVRINAVVGAEDADVAAQEAYTAAAAGYSCIKVKVGRGDDTARVAAVRSAVGPEIELRLDANGGYEDAGHALAVLARLSAFDIELCEEPVHGARRLADVAAEASMAIAADESTADPALFEAWCADAVCLKISGAGGISGVIHQADMAREHGYDVYLASTLDGPLGIAAALHAAAAIQPDRPCGLSTLDRFTTVSPLPVRGGQLAVPAGPGLGSGLIDWYATLGR